MFATQLSTIDSAPKIAMGMGLASSHSPHYILVWGLAQLKIVAAQLITIGGQLNLTHKFGMGQNLL